MLTNTLEVLPNAQETETPVPASDTQNETQPETALESLASICSVLAIGLFVMTFVFQNFEIPSGSMEKTLLIGDHVLVDRVTLAPPTSWAPFMDYREIHRGDIIVFLKPGEPDLFLVKRTIGIPGDHIHLRNGVVYLNGVPQYEPQAAMPGNVDDPEQGINFYRDDFPAIPPDVYEGVTPEWAAEMPKHIQNGDLVVPPGTVFAMGDNRTNSLDGRYWGFVPRADIIGRPLFVYWSFQTPVDEIDKQSIAQRLGFFVHILSHFVSQTLWKRTFHVIR
jgi:signal peptidase I